MPPADLADPSLLENTDVVTYLEELGRAAEAGRSLSDRTNNIEFRAGVIALDDGLIEGDAVLPHLPAAFEAAALSRTRGRIPDDTPYATDAPVHSALGDPVNTAVFLSCMFMLGALSAALIFRDPLRRIFGW